eukprot:tig00000178_g12707.t1
MSFASPRDTGSAIEAVAAIGGGGVARLPFSTERSPMDTSDIAAEARTAWLRAMQRAHEAAQPAGQRIQTAPFETGPTEAPAMQALNAPPASDRPAAVDFGVQMTALGAEAAAALRAEERFEARLAEGLARKAEIDADFESPPEARPASVFLRPAPPVVAGPARPATYVSFVGGESAKGLGAGDAGGQAGSGGGGMAGAAAVDPSKCIGLDSIAVCPASARSRSGTIVGQKFFADFSGVAYNLILERAKKVTLSLCGAGTTFNSYIAIMRGCDPATLAFDHSRCPGGGAARGTLVADLEAGVKYTVLVEGWRPSDAGAFALTLTASDPCEAPAAPPPPAPVFRTEGAASGGLVAGSRATLAWLAEPAAGAGPSRRPRRLLPHRRGGAVAVTFTVTAAAGACRPPPSKPSASPPRPRHHARPAVPGRRRPGAHRGGDGGACVAAGRDAGPGCEPVAGAAPTAAPKGPGPLEPVKPAAATRVLVVRLTLRVPLASWGAALEGRLLARLAAALSAAPARLSVAAKEEAPPASTRLTLHVADKPAARRAALADADLSLEAIAALLAAAAASEAGLDLGAEFPVEKGSLSAEIVVSAPDGTQTKSPVVANPQPGPAAPGRPPRRARRRPGHKPAASPRGGRRLVGLVHGGAAAGGAVGAALLVAAAVVAALLHRHRQPIATHRMQPTTVQVQPSHAYGEAFYVSNVDGRTPGNDDEPGRADGAGTAPISPRIAPVLA